ncbi:hypothetical protein N7517_011673, partial [Penicillium concentricum]
NVELLIYLGDDFDDRVHELPSGASDLLKLGLLSMHPEIFQQPLNLFQTKVAIEKIRSTVFLRFLPKEILPYIPQEASKIVETREKHIDDLPYISGPKLIVHLILCFDLSAEKKKRRGEVDLIRLFLQHLHSEGPVVFSPEQKKSLASGLDALTEDEEWNQECWRQTLAL